MVLGIFPHYQGRQKTKKGGSSMKCPLLVVALEAKGLNFNLREEDCLKEECAWWDNGTPGCAILTIAQELAIKRQIEEVKL